MPLFKEKMDKLRANIFIHSRTRVTINSFNRIKQNFNCITAIKVISFFKNPDLVFISGNENLQEKEKGGAP
jgi:hypothetical protein